MINLKLEKKKRLLSEKKEAFRLQEQNNNSAAVIKLIADKLQKEPNFRSKEDVGLIVNSWMSDRKFRETFIKVVKTSSGVKKEIPSTVARKTLYNILLLMLKAGKEHHLKQTKKILLRSGLER